MTLRKVILGVVCAGVLGLSGCGDNKARGPLPTEQDVAAKKLDAMKRLAASMAKEADGGEARAALEDFRNTVMDPRQNMAQTKEIVDIYTKTIQGKYKGTVATELHPEVMSLQAILKQSAK